ncbi:MAG: redox-sensing transcriptional repressor Rex [Oscillospiraceae bacterium]|nr:redox-sensing transcriptional repressor Rex [Oscillospiraceae bacterium]MDD6146007.1 redox-sensing transcriptional repressor Rex [Oscillospiraceae bacterium]
MKISFSTLKRLPVYLRYLKDLPAETLNVSATSIAAELGYGDVQVRKDLGSVSGAGRPKTGYNKNDLIFTLENYLGYNKIKKAVIVGAGKLGEALLGYSGFKDYGLDIVAAFDIREDNSEICGKPVLAVDCLGDFCRENNIHIGIITVPASSAQQICDQMCASGIKAIWSFAPIRLKVPENVLLHEENMAASLALLSKQLQQ